MSLIYTIEARSGYVELLCPACWKSVGQFTNEEAGELARANIQPFCFECESSRVDCVPSVYILEQDSYLMGIGYEIFLAEWLSDDILWRPKDLRMHRISYTTFFDLKTGLGPKYALKEISQ